MTQKRISWIGGYFLRISLAPMLALLMLVVVPFLVPLDALAAEDAESIDFERPSTYIPDSVWINPGELSYHFNRSAGYREDNWGFGAQLNYSHNIALLGGTFINSDRQRSHDFGVLWEPFEFGPVKLGGVVGAFDGYPYMEHGAWFPAALPMASVAFGRFGANFTVVPNYKNRLHGAFVTQLIFKVW